MPTLHKIFYLRRLDNIVLELLELDQNKEYNIEFRISWWRQRYTIWFGKDRLPRSILFQKHVEHHFVNNLQNKLNFYSISIHLDILKVYIYIIIFHK